MTPSRSTPRRSSRSGFTLVEIVIALTIVAILTAAAIPSFQGLREEQLAREPVAALVRLAKEARLRAMEEKRPYQIAFHSGAFTASRHFDPYLEWDQLDAYLKEGALESGEDPASDGTRGGLEPDSDPSVAANSALANAAPPRPARDDRWSETYELPSDTRYSITFWHELTPTWIEGTLVKLWVFQPSGICQPLSIDLVRESASFQVEFGALTADIVREVVELR